ncbi:MAG: metallophosphoesterase [Spirochaetota bacterium]
MPEELLTILHASDIHISPKRPEFTENFRAVMRYANRIKPDIFLITGDLIENIKEEEFRFYRKETEVIEMETWAVPGNHDLGNKKSVAGWVTHDRLSAYRRTVGEDRWHKVKNGVHFIGYNSVILESGYPEEREQNTWLMHELDAVPKGAPLVLCTHYPLFIGDPKEHSPEVKYWTVDSPSREKFLAIIKERKVLAYLCGHRHIPRKNRYADTDCIIAPSTAFSLGDVRESTAFNMVKIYADRIAVEEISIASILH